MKGRKIVFVSFVLIMFAIQFDHIKCRHINNNKNNKDSYIDIIVDLFSFKVRSL